MISVVMPLYAEPLAVLQRTVDAILRQTHADLELVAVVDDPSYAEAIEFLSQLASADERVRFVVNERNLGVWPSYNRGVREARGEYIAIQDADDVSLPQRLEKLLDYMTGHADVDVVGCGLEYVDADSGDSLMTRRYPRDAASAIRKYCPLAHATTLRKRSLHESFGYYDESAQYRHAADYELWCRWRVQGVRMANIDDVLYVYYQNSSNFKSQNVVGILRDTVRIKRDYAKRLGFGPTDYAVLAAERVAALLPTRLIVSLFYRLTRSRSRAAERSLRRR